MTPTNHGDSPWITVQLMTHSGDIHLLSRSFGSLRKQTLDHRQIQVQILFDGEMTAEETATLNAAIAGHDFVDVDVFETGRKYGYYTLPRNQGLIHRFWGLYAAHMDCDNEWLPEHLERLLTEIRTPSDEGWPHFVYSRREYIADDGAPETVPTGPSPLREWTKEHIEAMVQSPMDNFIDTGDFLIGVGTLYELGERFGCVWNNECRRFGDWDLVRRLALMGCRGRAIDVVSHRYHWTGKNVQLTRKPTEMVALPADTYELYKAQGLIK